MKSDHLTQSALSERLANAGILPMFGFPTRVRSLYQRPPHRLADESSAQVSDRSLEFAVSSFSPGSEVARDKQVHVCAGFAAWEFRGSTPRAVDPLGTPIRIKKCDSCGAVEPSDAPTGRRVPSATSARERSTCISPSASGRITHHATTTIRPSAVRRAAPPSLPGRLTSQSRSSTCRCR